MGTTSITMTLSPQSIDKAIVRIKQYRQDIINKTRLLAQRLAERGVDIAKFNIQEFDAIYTGELLASINHEKGAVVMNGSEWIIYTDCPWAQFVCFGTGIVGEAHPHPYAEMIGWKYDINNHGDAGWFYFNEGKWHWTKGFPSRPFMFETTIQLMREVTKVAREVFG